jgi:hypothetical protein
MSAASSMKKKKPARRIQLPYWVREFEQIRLAVLTLILTAVAVSAAIACSRAHWHAARDAETQARQARNAARDRLAHAEMEKLEIAAYQPQYAGLRERGLIGDEKRLDWADAMRQIQEQRKLMPISYEFAPQQPVRLETAMDLGGYQMRGTRMSMHMDLLHEGDLFVFLADLRQRSYYTVQECSIRRVASGPPAPLAPTLSADCTLNWLTLASAPSPAHPPLAIPRARP